MEIKKMIILCFNLQWEKSRENMKNKNTHIVTLNFYLNSKVIKRAFEEIKRN